MKTKEVKEKYLKFFKDSPRNHKEIAPTPLVLENDPTTLFTSSGMQPMIPYLMGEKHPEGKRLVNSQPSLRLQDIDEVGDTRHTTFFEMLGNWSLGDYYKEEQLAWYWEFITKELKLSNKRLWVSVFEGYKNIPKDKESARIWKKIGIPENKIVYYGLDRNWWSRSGVPDKMPVNEIGGLNSEVFFEFPQVKHSPKFGKECHPNCNCGRFSEIGNSVFIEYVKLIDGSLKELPQKNVDFGGGLERTVAAINDEPDIFKIDIFKSLIKAIEGKTGIIYGDNEEKDQSIRVIADHLRASEALIEGGVVPSNKLQGYGLRRLLRRSAIKMRHLKGSLGVSDLNLVKDKEVGRIIEDEISRFKSALEKGLKVINAFQDDQFNALNAFNLYQSYGIPLEIIKELFTQKGKKLKRSEFNRVFEDHKKLSRKTAAKIFKGGLADSSEEVTKLHTATHLLHAALRKVLGDNVAQKGSNITKERLRFDISHGAKLTDEELKQVEDMVNNAIKKDLPVSFETEEFKKAIGDGALAFFGEKYGEKVKVYTVGDPRGKWFSKEVCGGPHATSTGEIGRVRIKKQKKIGSGLIRLYAEVVKD